MNINMKLSKMSKSERTRLKEKSISFVILLIVCAIWVFPFIYMVGMSLKTDVDIGTNPTSIFPSLGNWTLEHYNGFLSMKGDRIDDLPIWMINSTVVTLLNVLFTLIVDTFAAYAFVFFKFKARKTIFTLLILSMTIPSVIMMTPQFTMYASIGQLIDGLANSRAYVMMWLILPSVANVFNLYLMKNFFDSIPKEIIESARSDGASDFKIFRSIVLPLAKSTLMIVALFSFVASWNDLLWPQLILSGRDSTFQTITVALTGYASGDSWEYKGIAMATAVFALLPILIVFIFTQNKMIDGLATTGVKK